MRSRWDADSRLDESYDPGGSYDQPFDPRGGGGRRSRGGGWTVIGSPFGILGGRRRGFGPGYGGGYRRGYGGYGGGYGGRRGGGGGCARDACLLESGCCLAESLDGSCLLLTLLALPQLLMAFVRPAGDLPRGSARTKGAGRGSRVLLALLAVYQRSVAARRPHPVCRYTPSCSAYAAEAVSRYGALRGLRLTAARLLRCRPSVAGGPDPVR